MTRFRGACRRGGRRERLLRLHGGNIDCTARPRKSVCEVRCKVNGKIVEQEGKTSHSGSAGALRQGRGERKTKRIQTVGKLTGKIANFRQVCRGRIYASRAVFSLDCIAGVAATGGIYAAPTNQTIIFIITYGRGRGIPRPYRAKNFYYPVGRGDPTPPQTGDKLKPAGTFRFSGFI